MIRPAALYNKARFSRDFASLGRVVAVLCANKHIDRGDLTDAELSSLEEIENENDEMDKTTAKEAKRKAEFRAARLSRNVPQCPELSQGQSGTSVAETVVPPCPAMSATTNQPTNHTTNLPTNQPNSIIHSITIPLVGDPNGNGNGMDSLVKDINEFVAAVHSDPDHGGNAFFDARFDPVVMACAIVGDRKSVRRWRKAVNDIGEDVVRQELFGFYRELRAGESVDNKGAALNARLNKIGARA